VRAKRKKEERRGEEGRGEEERGGEGSGEERRGEERRRGGERERAASSTTETGGRTRDASCERKKKLKIHCPSRQRKTWTCDDISP